MRVDSGYTSLVELEKLAKEQMIRASLHNRITEAVKNRDVNLVFYYGKERLVYGIKNCPEYTVLPDSSLYAVWENPFGTVLSVIR